MTTVRNRKNKTKPTAELSNPDKQIDDLVEKMKKDGELKILTPEKIRSLKIVAIYSVVLLFIPIVLIFVIKYFCEISNGNYCMAKGVVVGVGYVILVEAGFIYYVYKNKIDSL